MCWLLCDDNYGYINHGLETETRLFFGVVLFVDMVYTLKC